MAVSDEFRQYVIGQFSALGEVTDRKMFGGVGLYLGTKFFALIDNDELYFKVDDGTRGKFEKAGARAFEPWAGHVMNGYWSVPAEVLEDAAMLADWAKPAVAIAGKKAGKSKAKAPRKRENAKRK